MNPLASAPNVSTMRLSAHLCSDPSFSGEPNNEKTVSRRINRLELPTDASCEFGNRNSARSDTAR